MSTRDRQATQQFMNQRAPLEHEAFRVPSRYNKDTDRYEVPEIRELRDTLETYKKEEEVEGINFKLCTWDDVVEQMEEAQEAACKSDNPGPGFRGKLIRGNRIVVHAIPILEKALPAIPDELWFLHGALALVFSVAHHREQIRLKILRAFGELPNTVEMAQRNSEIFAGQPGCDHLQESVGVLKTVLLKVLPKLIRKLNPGKRKLGKALAAFQDADIDNMLEDIRLRVQAIRDTINSLKGLIVIKNHEATGRTEEQVRKLRKEVNEVLDQQKSLQASIEATNGQTWLYQFLVEHLKPRTSSAKSMPSSGRYTPESDSSGQPTQGPFSPPPPPETPETFMPHELLALLDVNHLASIADESHVLDRSRSMALNTETMGNAALMIKHPQVLTLLQASAPGAVLVNGHNAREKISPLSCVSATLAQSLRASNAGRNATLAFFCGKHVDADALSGPQGLMRSLLAQLILTALQKRWILDCESFGGLSHIVCKGQSGLALPGVCELFHLLLGAIPAGTSVFCLVDGLSFYETAGWAGELAVVMECFRGMVQDRQLGVFVKLLMTSSVSCRGPAWLERSQRISLRNRQGEAAGAWKRMLQSQNKSGIVAGPGLDGSRDGSFEDSPESWETKRWKGRYMSGDYNYSDACY